MYIKLLQEEIHRNSQEKGWWDEPRTFGDTVALCHSELSEALEAFRKGEPAVLVGGGKPEGIAVEMADAIIRILDWAEHEGIDMGEVIKLKNAYNETRSYRHGGKKL